MDLPMPRLPPVIRATLPFKDRYETSIYLPPICLISFIIFASEAKQSGVLG